MNRFYSGKPRGGKTKAAVIFLIERLRGSSRPIVTNMALRLHPWVDGKSVARPGLLRVLRDKYGDTFDAERRIYLLSNSEVRRFYAIRPIIPRGSGVRIVEIVPLDPSGEWRFDGDKFPGCDYIIDEAHVFFPRKGIPGAKELELTPELLGYASQAGRCGDECIFITQVLTNVNVQLRGVSQECHWFTNHAHARLAGFRQPDSISYRVYATTPPAAGEVWLARGVLRYKRYEIESCYDTAAGVGVTGNTAADIGQHAKGMPFWMIGVFICLAAVGFLLFTIAVRKGAQVAMGQYYKGKAKTEAASAATNSGVGLNSDQVLAIVRDYLRPTNVHQVQAATASMPLAAGQVSVPACYGWSRGDRVCSLDTEYGQLYGTNIQLVGAFAYLDGVQFRRVSRVSRPTSSNLQKANLP